MFNPHENGGEILTVKEVALWLRIPRSTVYKIAQHGKIPCQKVGRHWRFSREAILKWLEGQKPDPETDPTNGQNGPIDS